jgi:hypothetical protein
MIDSDLPIGEAFEFQGHRLMVRGTYTSACGGCFFKGQSCCVTLRKDGIIPQCAFSLRKSGTDVVFEEIV